MGIWDSNEYDNSNGSQIHDAEETMQQILKDNLVDMDIIVDVGCGSGNVTLILSKTLEHSKILAIDIDPEMVEYAEKNYKAETVKCFVQDIGVHWDDLSSILKDLENKVSLVWSNRVLHWVKDKTNAAKNIARLLKPGGRCYVNTTAHPDVFKYMKPEEVKEYEQLMKFESLHEQEENWKKYFNESGLTQTTIEFAAREWDLKDPKLFWGMWTAYDSFIKLKFFDFVPEEKQNETIAKLHDYTTKLSTSKFGDPPVDVIDPNHTIHYYGQFRIVGIK